MRFERIKIRGLGPYRGDVDVDLTGIDARIIAVTGDNGAGKSTLLELLGGALFRRCPTRGSLGSLATSRDAYVEATVVNGHRYTIRQTVDGVSGKGEALVLDADGAPVVESAKLRDFDAWASTHLPDPDVLYSSQFAVQGSRGFLDLSASERKRVLLRLLGIERLEGMAKAARDKAAAAKLDADHWRGMHQDLVAKGVDVAAAKQAVEDLEKRVADNDAQVAALTLALRRAEEAAQDVQRAAEIAGQRTSVVTRLQRATTERDGLLTRMTNNAQLLERRAEIEAAAQLHATIGAQLEMLQADARPLATDRLTATAAAAAADTAVNSHRRREADCARRASQALRRLDDEAAVLRADDRLPELRERQATATEVERIGRADLVEKRARLLSQKDRRLDGMRVGVQRIAGGVTDSSSVASDILRHDDAEAERAAALPQEILTAEAALAATGAELLEVTRKVQAAEVLAARRGEMEAARAEMAELEVERKAAEDAAEASVAEAKVHRARVAELLRAEADASSRVTEATQQRDALKGLVDLAPRLAVADARIEELQAQVASQEQSIADAALELEALPDVQQLEAVDLAAQKVRLAGAEQAARNVRELIGEARGAVQVVIDRVAQMNSHGRQLREAEALLADWTRVAQDLGRDGLQAMEIDAAVPELNTMANALLHDCHGPRFTVEVRTDKLSSDGKRVLEGLDVRVIDTVNGRDELAETYSGGECVIVGEAIALALTMIACRRSGAERPTLCRDESGAALDPGNARAYIAMLRKAAAALDASNVLFVSHSQETQDLADARIHIEDGRVEVRP